MSDVASRAFSGLAEFFGVERKAENGEAVSRAASPNTLESAAGGFAEAMRAVPEKEGFALPTSADAAPGLTPPPAPGRSRPPEPDARRPFSARYPLASDIAPVQKRSSDVAPARTSATTGDEARTLGSTRHPHVEGDVDAETAARIARLDGAVAPKPSAFAERVERPAPQHPVLRASPALETEPDLETITQSPAERAAGTRDDASAATKVVPQAAVDAPMSAERRSPRFDEARAARAHGPAAAVAEPPLQSNTEAAPPEPLAKAASRRPETKPSFAPIGATQTETAPQAAPDGRKREALQAAHDPTPSDFAAPARQTLREDEKALGASPSVAARPDILAPEASPSVAQAAPADAPRPIDPGVVRQAGDTARRAATAGPVGDMRAAAENRLEATPAMRAAAGARAAAPENGVEASAPDAPELGSGRTDRLQADAPAPSPPRRDGGTVAAATSSAPQAPQVAPPAASQAPQPHAQDGAQTRPASDKFGDVGVPPAIPAQAVGDTRLRSGPAPAVAAVAAARVAQRSAALAVEFAADAAAARGAGSDAADVLSAPVQGGESQSSGMSAPPGAPASATPGAPYAATAARAVAQAIASAQDANRVELRLDPPELGRVLIDMRFDDGAVTASISAERAETLDMLRRNVEALQRELAQAGFEGADIGFAHRDPGGEAQARDEGVLREGAAATAAAPAPGSAATLARGAAALGRLDIRL